MIVQNKTTLEYLENKVDAQRGDYNLGCWGNVSSVLGEECLLWCVPICKYLCVLRVIFILLGPNLNGEGVNFLRK